MQVVRTRSGIMALALAASVVACGEASDFDPVELNSTGEALTIGNRTDAIAQGGKYATAKSFAERANMPHGIGGDEHLVFVTEPLNGAVVALDRHSGAELAQLPPPPGGFLLPFTLRVPHTGRIVILDAGGFPDPNVPAIPRVYEYDYELKRKGKNGRIESFDATLARAVVLENLPILFTEDLEVLDDGTIVVSESVLGALWIVHTDDTVAPGIVPVSFDPADAIPGLNPCGMPLIDVGGIPFITEGAFAPGVGTMTEREGNLYFGNTCTGGLWKVPVATLFDQSRAPHERGEDIELVSPMPANVVAESLKGLTWNRWNPGDRRILATDPFRLQLIRINIDTGEREVLVQNELLFNFPVAAAWLPPSRGPFEVVVASDQEHRLAALNAGIDEDQFLSPFLLTHVHPRH